MATKKKTKKNPLPRPIARLLERTVIEIVERGDLNESVEILRGKLPKILREIARDQDGYLGATRAIALDRAASIIEERL